MTEDKKLAAKVKREEKKRLEEVAAREAQQKFLDSRAERTEKFWTKALELYVKKLTNPLFDGHIQVADCVNAFTVDVDLKRVEFREYNIVTVDSMLNALSARWFENQIEELEYVETMMNLEIQQEKDRVAAELRRMNLREEALAKLSEEEREALGL